MRVVNGGVNVASKVHNAIVNSKTNGHKPVHVVENNKTHRISWVN